MNLLTLFHGHHSQHLSAFCPRYTCTFHHTTTPCSLPRQTKYANVFLRRNAAVEPPNYNACSHPTVSDVTARRGRQRRIDERTPQLTKQQGYRMEVAMFPHIILLVAIETLRYALRTTDLDLQQCMNVLFKMTSTFTHHVMGAD